MPAFDVAWPFVAEAFRTQWQARGPLDCVRLEVDDARAVHEVVADPASVTRLVVLGVPFTADSVTAFGGLREAALPEPYGEQETAEQLRAAGVEVHRHDSEGFWGQSVAEFGLALTLCGLRRIPQLHHQILTDLAPWDYDPPDGVPRPGGRGHQYGDDPRFTRRHRLRRPGTGRGCRQHRQPLCRASPRRWVPTSRPGTRTRREPASTVRVRAASATSTGWCPTRRSSRRWCR